MNLLIDEVESLVDSHDVEDVVSALVSVCHGKADHLRENWQDEASAKVFDQWATKLDKVFINRRSR